MFWISYLHGPILRGLSTLSHHTHVQYLDADKGMAIWTLQIYGKLKEKEKKGKKKPDKSITCRCTLTQPVRHRHDLKYLKGKKKKKIEWENIEISQWMLMRYGKLWVSQPFWDLLDWLWNHEILFNCYVCNFFLFYYIFSIKNIK